MILRFDYTNLNLVLYFAAPNSNRPWQCNVFVTFKIFYWKRLSSECVFVIFVFRFMPFFFSFRLVSDFLSSFLLFNRYYFDRINNLFVASA